MYAYEHACITKGYKYIAGIDEAGRGALAGPVVAAAVILPMECQIEGVIDSKKLTAKQRDVLVDVIKSKAISVGVGISDNNTIDQINILQATLQAMNKAVTQLAQQPDYLLVDGSKMPNSHISGEAIPKGDNLSVSIAAASIVAKTTRDRIMIEFDRLYPEYSFQQHKGYPTALHRRAIVQFGPTEIHRKTFKLYVE
ncbi:ribonuclease HII [Candidatus Poribacteria bacterium]|nr:MAG: ribonuclease HII [Candidatus Poribacteria bacterium]